MVCDDGIVYYHVRYSSFKLIPKPQNDTAEVVQYFVFEGIEPPVAQEPTCMVIVVC